MHKSDLPKLAQGLTAIALFLNANQADLSELHPAYGIF
jgi:hypothetical protein